MFDPTAYRLAISYGRFSSDRQEVTSIERQDLQAEQACQEFGWTLIEAHADEGMSGTGKHRKKGKLGILVERLKNRPNKKDRLVVIVEDIDRLTREKPLAAYGLLIDLLDDANVGIWLCAKRQGLDRNSVNQPGAWHVITAYIDAACGLIESMRNRALRQHERLWRTNAVTKLHPFWISIVDGRYELNERAGVIQDIFRWCIDGLSYNDIAIKLNRASTASPSRTKIKHGWHENTIRTYLRSRKALGEMRRSHVDPDNRGGKVNFETEWHAIYPPAITLETWEKAQAAIDRRVMATGGPSGTNFNNIMRGMVRCHQCRGACEMRRSGSGSYSGNSYLVCRNARRGKCDDKSSQNYEALEKFIVGALGDSAIGWQQKDSAVAGELLRQIDDVRHEIKQIEEDETALIGQNIRNIKAIESFLSKLQDDKAAALSRIGRLEARLHKERGTLDLTEAHEQVMAMIKAMDEMAPTDRYEIRKKLHAGLQRLIQRIVSKPGRVVDFHLMNRLTLTYANGKMVWASAAGSYETGERLMTAQEVIEAIKSGGDVMAVAV